MKPKTEIKQSTQLGVKPCSFPPLSREWVEGLERAKLREQSLLGVWEREYQHRMSYDEFHMRRSLQLAVSRGEMAEEQAWGTIKKLKLKPKTERQHNG